MPLFCTQACCWSVCARAQNLAGCGSSSRLYPAADKSNRVQVIQRSNEHGTGSPPHTPPARDSKASDVFGKSPGSPLGGEGSIRAHRISASVSPSECLTSLTSPHALSMCGASVAGSGSRIEQDCEEQLGAMVVRASMPGSKALGALAALQTPRSRCAPHLVMFCCCNAQRVCAWCGSHASDEGSARERAQRPARTVTCTCAGSSRCVGKTIPLLINSFRLSHPMVLTQQSATLCGRSSRSKRSRTVFTARLANCMQSARQGAVSTLHWCLWRHVWRLCSRLTDTTDVDYTACPAP